MRQSVILVALATGLASCGQGSGESSTNAAIKASAPEKPRPAYCFFKDHETKGWKATVGKDGFVVVSGKAYRSDSRYKALLTPAKVSGTTAELSPTIMQNDTGFGAPDDWWDVSLAIPGSQAVTSVKVTCGRKTFATLTVQRKK